MKITHVTVQTRPVPNRPAAIYVVTHWIARQGPVILEREVVNGLN